MNIIELINSRQDLLSKGQRKIGNLIIHNIDRVCFMSLKEFSGFADTTPVSVLRFARKLGLESFINLKKELQAYTSSRFTPNDKLLTAIEKVGSEFEEAIQEVWQMDMLNIQRSYEILDPKEILRASEILKNSEQVYLAANNISRGIAVCFHSRLNAVSINTTYFDFLNIGLMMTRLSYVKPTDAFIIITFPHYTQELVFLANQLKRRGVPVILISDTNSSKLAESADVVLKCSTDTPIFFNSYSAAMVMANVLTSIVALQMEDRFSALREQKRELVAVYEEFINLSALYEEIP